MNFNNLTFCKGSFDWSVDPPPADINCRRVNGQPHQTKSPQNVIQPIQSLDLALFHKCGKLSEHCVDHKYCNMPLDPGRGRGTRLTSCSPFQWRGTTNTTERKWPSLCEVLSFSLSRIKNENKKEVKKTKQIKQAIHWAVFTSIGCFTKQNTHFVIKKLIPPNIP